MSGNLLVVMLGLGGTASADSDSLIEAIPGASPTIWYCITTGGSTSITFAGSGLGAWFFELAEDSPGWLFLDARQSAGTVAATNIYSPSYPSAISSIENAVSLTGDASNCCYFTVLNGQYVGMPQLTFSNGWRVHPHVFGTGSVGDGDTNLSTACILLNASGVQQFQRWFQGDSTGYEWINTVGVAFSSTEGSTAGGGPSDVDQFLPNVWVVS